MRMEEKQITENQHQVFRGYYKKYSSTRNDNDLVFFDKSGKLLNMNNAKLLTVESFLYELDDLEPNALENYPS